VTPQAAVHWTKNPPEEPVGHKLGASSGRLLSIASRLAREAALLPALADLSERCWTRIAESESYEAWAIGWPPRGSIDLHDHGDSAGAVFVVSGQLTETRLVRGDGGRTCAEVTSLFAGDSIELPSWCVHDVVNLGSTSAVSIHVYGPKLRSMTYYSFEGESLIPLRKVSW